MPPETQQGEIKHKITHDMVLDVYETSLTEPDEEKRQAIVATAEVMSQNIGGFLVDINVNNNS